VPYTFTQALNAFKNNEIRELSLDRSGMRFLKLRSLSRKDYMLELLSECGIEAPRLSGNSLLQFVFESAVSDEQIENTIQAIYQREREVRRAREDQLVSELYRLDVFDWGGLHQNSLERTIVDNYVKKITSFDRLCECVEDELHHSMRSYVLCSWYNHWSSIVIEDIFRDHSAVLPAVGLIKKVDFFVGSTPFDLKVTYLPEGFVKDVRREQGLRPELTLLKQMCRRQRIHWDSDLPVGRLLPDLWAKVKDHPASEATDLIAELTAQRLAVVDSAMQDPTALIRWLYENQGVRRFDAANRLFLVLVDCSNFFESWRLKRAKPLLSCRIHTHLDRMVDEPGMDLSFEWEGEHYTVTSDVIFVCHNRA
jgi:hypothetical protein